MRWILLSVLATLLIGGCGDAQSDVSNTAPTGVTPVVTRLDPTTATAGDTVTIFGAGFSVVPTANIIVIGNIAVAASTYAVVDPPAAGEVEQLTFIVPTGLTTGADAVLVLVEDAVSNTNVQLTVNP